MENDRASKASIPKGLTSKRGGARPGAGRPRKPPEVEARAVELAEALGSTEEAARVLTAEGTPVDASSVRGWKRARAVLAPAGEVTAVEAASELGEAFIAPDVIEAPPLPSDVASAIVSRADPDKARAVRRLVAGMGGVWDGEAVASLAVTWGCALADVQALVIEASIEAGRCALPPELAREEALATLRWVRDKAKDAADFRSATVAAGEILKIQLAAQEASDVLTKAQFVALARQLAAAVAPWPEAHKALMGVLVPSSEG